MIRHGDTLAHSAHSRGDFNENKVIKKARLSLCTLSAECDAWRWQGPHTFDLRPAPAARPVCPRSSQPEVGVADLEPLERRKLVASASISAG